MIMATENNDFGYSLLALRKQKSWSQPELSKKIGTSGAIIGRYERGEKLMHWNLQRKNAYYQ